MVDVHAHLSALLAADLVVRQLKSCLFPTFYSSKALSLIFSQKMICNA